MLDAYFVMRHNSEMSKTLNDPAIIDIGFMGIVVHQQPCAIYHSGDAAKPAVHDCDGRFQPSWEAQREGWKLIHAEGDWKLVQAKTRFQRWLLKQFFDKKDNT